MKTFIILTLATLTLAAQAQVSECSYKLDEQAGKAYVVPVYSAEVLYYFDDVNKKAMANVQWKFNSELTSACGKKIEGQLPGITLKLPPMNHPELEVEVLYGLEKEKMITYREIGEQLHGHTDMIQVNYKAKKDILKAIAERQEMVKINGNLAYEYEKTSRGIVGHIECSSKNEQKGISVLQKRLGEVMKLVSGYSQAKVDRDTILENFMGHCVEIEDIESDGLVKLSRKTKLRKEKLPVEGEIVTTAKESIPAASVVEAKYIEY